MAGTMSILESDRAIIQAEEVTTLTRLAFFFIQLTYASGIFGMNIKELADADMSTWIITSACLLLACYSILRPIALIYTLFAGLYDATLPIWIIPLIIYILRAGLKTSSMKVDDTLRHCESTFSAFIGTMSINESTRAIREAKEVTKSTQLATFFIPLTFVAGIFGMNLEELANLRLWV
ncbi:hypothetical protein BKA81DRAFT_374690 [Phyllosticta paracitricarpa]|uniref:Uncharacterized protein n=1 Tax=Phyllosticta paracitricarpa TaxID=2016321 RepID=A0ABR1MVF6_9PEZI